MSNVVPIGSLAVEDLLQRARKEAGLDDFGDPGFLEPLRKVVSLIGSEANLVSTDVGVVHRMVGCLVDRLRLVDFVRAHPDILDEEVDVVGVIIGLARGGSTLLQRLLGASPQLTSIYKYEVCAPLPLPGTPVGDRQSRIDFAQEVLDDMAARWPDMASMHPMTTMDYEEEIELMDRSFMSVMYGFYFHLPSYAKWEFDQDHGKSYEELLLWLKVLQYQDPSRRGMKWLLKSPQHLMGGGLRTCLETFPKARILMTHRNLRSVVGSAVSLRHAMLKDVTRDLDPRDLGPEAVEHHVRALGRLIEVRDEGSAKRFLDVQYSDLVSDPLGVFESTLSELGLEVGESDRAAARSWMASHERDTHPPHRYRLEDYGVDLDRFDEMLSFYHERFVEPAGPTT